MKRIDYLDFISRVVSHIPDEGQFMCAYYGLYTRFRLEKMKRTSLGP